MYIYIYVLDMYICFHLPTSQVMADMGPHQRRWRSNYVFFILFACFNTSLPSLLLFEVAHSH